MRTPSQSHYVQYGCGLDAPEGWLNFDASPTLRLQRLPLLGRWLRNRMDTRFPSNVRFGNIIFGLPVPPGSCQGVYCSHVLEHLALEDFRQALKQTFSLLRSEGIFRCVVPDLLHYAKVYVEAASQGDAHAGPEFVGRRTALGRKTRPRRLRGLIHDYTRTTGHRWMWDRYSLGAELESAGFTGIRPCTPGDCEDPMFARVEKPGRFVNAVAMQCRKP